jgi:hypothetical protein
LKPNFDLKIRDEGSIYNDILASIGLNSTTLSSKSKGIIDNNDPNHTLGAQLVSIPIHNNVTSLTTLGKYVLLSGQGKIWKFRSKSPLGRHGKQFIAQVL